MSRKPVAQLMREHDWAGVSGRIRVRTTIVHREAKADLVDCDVDPTEPDVIWCDDLHTGEGWLFLMAVIDLCSRRVIGWSIAEDMHFGA